MLECDATAAPASVGKAAGVLYSAPETIARRLELRDSVRWAAAASAAAAAAGGGAAHRLARSRLDRAADARAECSCGVDPPCAERREESRRDAAAPRGEEADNDPLVAERKWFEPRAVRGVGPAPRAVSCLL